MAGDADKREVGRMILMVNSRVRLYIESLEQDVIHESWIRLRIICLLMMGFWNEENLVFKMQMIPGKESSCVGLLTVWKERSKDQMLPEPLISSENELGNSDLC